MAFSNAINISATISSTPDNSLGCFAKLLYVWISVFISFTVFMSSVLSSSFQNKMASLFKILHSGLLSPPQ